MTQLNTFLIVFADGSAGTVETETCRVWENQLIFERTIAGGNVERVRTFSLFQIRSWEQVPT